MKIHRYSSLGEKQLKRLEVSSRDTTRATERQTIAHNLGWKTFRVLEGQGEGAHSTDFLTRFLSNVPLQCLHCRDSSHRIVSGSVQAHATHATLNLLVPRYRRRGGRGFSSVHGRRPPTCSTTTIFALNGIGISLYEVYSIL